MDIRDFWHFVPYPPKSCFGLRLWDLRAQMHDKSIVDQILMRLRSVVSMHVPAMMSVLAPRRQGDPSVAFFLRSVG